MLSQSENRFILTQRILALDLETLAKNTDLLSDEKQSVFRLSYLKFHSERFVRAGGDVRHFHGRQRRHQNLE